MNQDLAAINYVIGVVGIIYCCVILTVLLFRKIKEPDYSTMPQKKATVFQRAVNGIMKGRIKPIRHTETQLWEMSENDNRNQYR